VEQVTHNANVFSAISMTHFFIGELVTFYFFAYSSGPVCMGHLAEIMDHHQNKYFWSWWIQNWHYCTWICPWLVCQSSLFPTVNYISVFDNVHNSLGRQTYTYTLSILHECCEEFEFACKLFPVRRNKSFQINFMWHLKWKHTDYQKTGEWGPLLSVFTVSCLTKEH